MMLPGIKDHNAPDANAAAMIAVFRSQRRGRIIHAP
jgi:hypothetical protein